MTRGGPPPSVGRPCRTTTERQGVVDGALGPANDARDGSAAQTPAGVAARDGQEGLGTTPTGNDCGLAAGLIEAELVAGERIFGVLDAKESASTSQLADDVKWNKFLQDSARRNNEAAGLLLLVGVSSRASILVGQVPHSLGLGNMA